MGFNSGFKGLSSSLQVGPTVCTYLYSQAKFRHISVADTTTVREDNTTDQKTPLLPAV